jgi:hypothetical protein
MTGRILSGTADRNERQREEREQCLGYLHASEPFR